LLEFATASWFRFGVFLLWLFLLFASLASLASGGAGLAMLFWSPFAALGLMILVRLAGWLFYFVPGAGPLWGYGRLIFMRLFSRLVAEPAPDVELPLWHEHRRH
jgi:hypothetical protein